MNAPRLTHFAGSFHGYSSEIAVAIAHELKTLVLRQLKRMLISIRPAVCDGECTVITRVWETRRFDMGAKFLELQPYESHSNLFAKFISDNDATILIIKIKLSRAPKPATWSHEGYE